MVLVKWIVVTVPEHQRAAFERSQQTWANLAYCAGFLGQVGGWIDDGRACILGVWQDDAAYARFMHHTHDPILFAAPAEAIDMQLDIQVASVITRMPGEAADVAAALRDATFLRVADCTIDPVHREAFVRAQLQVWTPGMGACPGMLGGVFSSVADDRYLVTTLWADAAAHTAYLDGPFTGLRARAAPNTQLTRLEGFRVPLLPAWHVLPA